MKTLRLIIPLLGLCLGLPACAGDQIRWTEEVKLSDGKVIQIQRHVELTRSGFPLQKRGFHKFHEICYPPMNIHWKSKPGYQPDIFDIVEGKAYMHVPVTSAAECYEQGSPETNALYFVWDNGHWRRIPQEEFPVASEWNLMMQTVDAQGLITTQDKASGPWDDTLRYLQKRQGWKRINQSPEKGKGCLRWGSPLPEKVREPDEIIVPSDTKNCG